VAERGSAPEKCRRRHDAGRRELTKKALLEHIVAEHGRAFFTHDPSVAAARIERDASGKYIARDARAALS
jgi:hypothetical protein